MFMRAKRQRISRELDTDDADLTELMSILNVEEEKVFS